MTLWRILESLHGHLAILATAALVHPAILLRRGKPMSRRTRLAVILTAVTVVLAFGSGLLIYPQYVSSVRLSLFLESTRAGLLFETKEHVAFAVVALTVAATACALLAPRDEPRLRKASAALFACGAGLCLLTAALGTYVSGVHGFGSAR